MFLNPYYLVHGIAALVGSPRQIEVCDRDTMILDGVPARPIIMGLTVGISTSGLGLTSHHLPDSARCGC